LLTAYTVCVGVPISTQSGSFYGLINTCYPCYNY